VDHLGHAPTLAIFGDQLCAVIPQAARADEHELNLGAGQGSQQFAMAILDLDHTDTRCSLRALRDE